MNAFQVKPEGVGFWRIQKQFQALKNDVFNAWNGWINRIV